jgi:hypothetical protein
LFKRELLDRGFRQFWFATFISLGHGNEIWDKWKKVVDSWRQSHLCRAVTDPRRQRPGLQMDHHTPGTADRYILNLPRPERREDGQADDRYISPGVDQSLPGIRAHDGSKSRQSMKPGIACVICVNLLMDRLHTPGRWEHAPWYHSSIQAVATILPDVR